MTYCSDCIHYKVCGNEGVDDLAMTYCADKKTDVISQSVVDQIRWERDVALDQLNQLGYGLGEKPREHTAEWKIENSGGTTMWYECTKCGEAGDIWDKFCKHCGRKMTNCGAKIIGEE